MTGLIMFSGIVERTGRIRSVERLPEALAIEVDTGFPDLVLGESVAVQGVCLTVARFPDTVDRSIATFFVSRETLARTTFGGIEPSRPLNLERSLKLGDRLSGHWVQGHVDGLARVAAVKAEAECLFIDLDLPAELARYAVHKGSIAVDGVSLTVNALQPSANGGALASLAIIPHTAQVTTLGELRAGHAVHIEVDVLAKYVEKLCHPYKPR